MFAKNITKVKKGAYHSPFFLFSYYYYYYYHLLAGYKNPIKNLATK
jgi:hypothetical protein